MFQCAIHDTYVFTNVDLLTPSPLRISVLESWAFRVYVSLSPITIPGTKAPIFCLSVQADGEKSRRGLHNRMTGQADSRSAACDAAAPQSL